MPQEVEVIRVPVPQAPLPVAQAWVVSSTPAVLQGCLTAAAQPPPVSLPPCPPHSQTCCGTCSYVTLLVAVYLLCHVGLGLCARRYDASGGPRVSRLLVAPQLGRAAPQLFRKMGVLRVSIDGRTQTLH